MTYKKALEAARQGKRISRRGWGQLYGWYHVILQDNMLMMCDPMNGSPTILRQWEYGPSDTDISARDWEVIE